ncbi:MAG: hypothetical protein U9N07_00245, partial [Euryarchaeota archaeon]|nr:hypothetical protein [Euryarchaeota archaeon]
MGLRDKAGKSREEPSPKKRGLRAAASEKKETIVPDEFKADETEIFTPEEAIKEPSSKKGGLRAAAAEKKETIVPDEFKADETEIFTPEEVIGEDEAESLLVEQMKELEPEAVKPAPAITPSVSADQLPELFGLTAEQEDSESTGRKKDRQKMRILSMIGGT